MTPERAKELDWAAHKGFALASDKDYHEASDALTALTDQLLRHLGAPRVPTKISKARLAQIEAAFVVDRYAVVWVAPWTAVTRFYEEWKHREMQKPAGWYRVTFESQADGNNLLRHHGPYPTLRAALEAPVVRRAGCPPVIEFEVEQ